MNFPNFTISKEAAVKIPRAIGLILILHFGLDALADKPEAEAAPQPTFSSASTEYRYEN